MKPQFNHLLGIWILLTLAFGCEKSQGEIANDREGFVSFVDSFLRVTYPEDYEAFPGVGDTVKIQDSKLSISPSVSSQSQLDGTFSFPPLPVYCQLFHLNMDEDEEKEYFLFADIAPVLTWNNHGFFFDDDGHERRFLGEVNVPAKNSIEQVEFRHLRTTQSYEVLIYRDQSPSVYRDKGVKILGLMDGKVTEFAQLTTHFYDWMDYGGENGLKEGEGYRRLRELTFLDVNGDGIEEIQLKVTEAIVEDSDSIGLEEYPVLQVISEKEGLFDFENPPGR